MGEGAEAVTSLTPTQVRALTILRDHGPLTPRAFAQKMWPDSPGWQRCYKCGPHGASDGIMMALAGGGYLGKLRQRGLATVSWDGWHLEHVISAEGRRLLRERGLTT